MKMYTQVKFNILSSVSYLLFCGFSGNANCNYVKQNMKHNKLSNGPICY